MVVISETSDDSSNGGVPTKNPQEEENLNVKPKEEDHLVHQNLAPIPRHIPMILIERTVALVRRCHYPRLSLLSRAFRDVISSDQLFITRSLLGLTEPVLYTLISLPPFEFSRWYVLHQSNLSLRLTRISSLPPILRGSTTVTIGHKMYVMGGRNGLNQHVSTVIAIDCRFHKWEYLQSMKRDRCYAASGVIYGKIYVVGGRRKSYDDWVEVFDVENGIWETVPGMCCFLAPSNGDFRTHVVLDNKIYILDGNHHCLAYVPRQRKWQNWGPESQQRLFWNASSCVVDNLLYATVPESFLGSPMIVYDPRAKDWRPVKGVDDLPSLNYTDSRMASFGGKLMILGWHQSQSSYVHYQEENVLCVEVALGRREDGDIWGKVVESTSVLHTLKSPFIEISRTVTV